MRRPHNPVPANQTGGAFFRALLMLTAIAAGLVASSAPGRSHEIPADIYTTVLVKPEGQQLRVAVRVPLTVVRDYEYPAEAKGYLDFEAFKPHLDDLAVLWVAQGMQVYENGAALAAPRVEATQLSLLSDRSFASYDQAVARLRQAKPGNDTKVVWQQLWFDVLLVYPIASAQSNFSLRTGFEKLAMRVSVALRYLPPGGEERAYSLHIDGGAGDTAVLPLDPRWHQAFGRFVAMGFEHILGGIDHLLFLACLVIPLRRLKPLVLVVTAFTLAHSITLLSAAMGYAPDALWFPPLVEVCIALSIVYMAFENIVRAVAGTRLNPNGQAGVASWHRRWKLAFGFGLIHGFGFSFALQESLQFAGVHLTSSLLAFNLGVELGQIIVLLLLAPALSLLFRFGVAEGIGSILLSALIAHTGWHWMVERGEALGAYFR
jgi:hypothetical protein